jgi:phosphoribosylanthranilate isomerase
VGVEAKICGITRPEDAALAVRHGASRLGVILAWGPRLVTIAQVREIVAAAEAVPVLGVVRDAPAAELLELASAAGLSGVQFHEGGTAGDAAELRRHGLEVWRAATVEASDDLPALLAERRVHADAVLVEPRRTDRSSGRASPLPHDLSQRARAVLAGHRMILAGGLTPETVGTVITAVGPDGVDVSSGVESAPGIKSPERLIRFLEIVRDAVPTSRPGP